MEILNYRVKDFIKLDLDSQNQYTKLLILSKPLPGKKDLWDLKLKHIEQLKTCGFEDFTFLAKIISKMYAICIQKVLYFRIT